ncbi:MAG: branched-chain amino acid ABC transporter ATP-binding protein [Spirochaetes bacterium]|nr:MAG: branched-chain amino acid ABC transporter ATP-binding protein [Spirochaetota bacterium]
MIRIRNLESGYGKLRVLKGISIHVNTGEIVAIIGGNGAGKTTLLYTIANLVKPFSGTITVLGTDSTGLSPEKTVALGCSLVPEGRQLFPTMTVRENLILGSYPLMKKREKRRLPEEMERIYSLFPRLKERENQLAGTLSGGEQQMLAIGRALMSDPQFIMMDEPSMGLAPIIARDIFNKIEDLRNHGRTILLVEQNARAALRIADRGYVMETGNLIIEGSSEELMDNPDVGRAYLGKDFKRISE